MSPVPSVLVVEDDPALRDLVASTLEDEGYRVATAADGAEALEKVRADPPRAIVLDLMLPVMDGVAFLLACRADPRCREIPVVVTSARYQGAAGLALGAAAFLAKPFDLDALVRTVARLL